MNSAIYNVFVLFLNPVKL